MRNVIIFLIITTFLFIGGCATIKANIPIVMPDNTVETIDLEYIRWFNQKIEGFYLEKTKDGWIVKFDRQGADNQATFGIGPYKITVGDNEVP
jgi:hypothetical protein